MMKEKSQAYLLDGVIVKLMGGLGNQMFQYAVARRISLKHNVPLLLDLSTIEKDTKRRYELDKFNIAAYPLSPEQSQFVNLPFCFSKPRKLFFWMKQRFMLGATRRYLVEHGSALDMRVIDASPNSFLVGFWQNEMYFADIRETLLSEFTLRSGPVLENSDLCRAIKETTSVSLHVRRGDYASESGATRHHGLCPTDYYMRAIDWMKQVEGSFQIFVFSDDIDWCKANLKTQMKMTFVERGMTAGPHEDLALMSLCKHNIIANSSFSWWAGWLNRNQSKSVVAPQQWGCDPSWDTSNIVPRNWIRF